MNFEGKYSLMPILKYPKRIRPILVYNYDGDKAEKYEAYIDKKGIERHNMMKKNESDLNDLRELVRLLSQTIASKNHRKEEWEEIDERFYDEHEYKRMESAHYMFLDTEYMNIRAYIKMCIKILTEMGEENEKEIEQTKKDKDYGEIIKPRAIGESKKE